MTCSNLQQSDSIHLWQPMLASQSARPLLAAGFCACLKTPLNAPNMLQGTNSEMREDAGTQRKGAPQTPLEEKLRKRMTVDHKVDSIFSCACRYLRLATRAGSP